jgi:hypothetical protein
MTACYGQLQAMPRRLRRVLQRKLALPLAGIALLLVLAPGPSHAATTWTVCASGCAYTTIQAAINAATTVAGDLIAVSDAVHTEAGISVTKDLSIVGQGANSTVVQAAATPFTASTRVFTIVPGVTVTIQALTLRHGTLQTIPDSGLLNAGGGLLNEGTLTLTNSTVTGNRSFEGGGLSNVGTLTLTNSTVSGNSSGYGGGIDNSGTLTLTNSTVSRNSSSYGGGLWNEGMLTLTNSTVSGNSSGYGGGIHNSGTLSLTNSTINTNWAYIGAGIANGRTLTLTNSTVSGNYAIFRTGAILNDGTLTLINSTISDNQGDYGPALASNGMLTLTNSIVANNLVSGDCLIYSGATSLGYNMDSDGSCQLTAPTDQPGVDPKLGPLQDNGGPTFTHALLPGSPAIDANPWGTNGCGTTLISDQRWQARPQPAGGACDIGAYEVEVTGQALGGWVTGFTPHTMTCKNITTGQVVTLSAPTSPWDCTAAGLGVTPGDHVAMHVRGPVKKGATDVGGAVVGMAPSSGGCTNLTTGQQVQFQHLVGAMAASCRTAGLLVHPGDTVQMSVQGAAE